MIFLDNCLAPSNCELICKCHGISSQRCSVSDPWPMVQTEEAMTWALPDYTPMWRGPPAGMNVCVISTPNLATSTPPQLPSRNHAHLHLLISIRKWIWRQRLVTRPQSRRRPMEDARGRVSSDDGIETRRSGMDHWEIAQIKMAKVCSLFHGFHKQCPCQAQLSF